MRRNSRWKFYKSAVTAGPGLVAAATGIGVGDIIATSMAGAEYGFSLIWAVCFGALLKFALSEGIARWQLASGKTILEGWFAYFGGWIRYFFGGYLLLWTLAAGGAVTSACGLAAHALIPIFSVPVWGAIHSVAAALLVASIGFSRFETVMKAFVAIMVLAVCGCAYFLPSSWGWMNGGIYLDAFNAGDPTSVISVIGAIGGSLTLLSYGYWMRKHRWDKAERLSDIRIDLGASYVVTAIFGIASLILAAKSLYGTHVTITGPDGILQLARALESHLGSLGKAVYLVGFWSAATSSLVGTWQSVPYIFCDFFRLARDSRASLDDEIMSSSSAYYRISLAYLALAPLLLTFFHEPISLIIIFTVVAGIFMPFVAGSLLVMNSSSDWVLAPLRNRWKTNCILGASILLFAYLGIADIRRAAHKIWPVLVAQTEHPAGNAYGDGGGFHGTE